MCILPYDIVFETFCYATSLQDLKISCYFYNTLKTNENYLYYKRTNNLFGCEKYDYSVNYRDIYLFALRNQDISHPFPAFPTFPHTLMWKNRSVSDIADWLYIALMYGHLDTVTFLIKYNDVFLQKYSDDYMDLSGDTISIAAEHGHIDVVKYLLSINISRDIARALQSAVLCNRYEICKLLIESDNLLHSKDRLFCDAAEYGYTDIVELLLDNGVDIHTNEDLALRIAATNGNVETVKFLVAKGADIHVRNDDPLRSAIHNKHWITAEFLILKIKNKLSS